MENKVVNELNTLLKGEHMAIKAYEEFIDAAEDQKVKDAFRKIQGDHQRHAGELTGRIAALGGRPGGSTGMAGLMAKAKINMENMINNDTKEILKHAYDGEDKGIAMVEEIIKGDLDSESLGMVKKMLSEDHDHLSRMAHMLSGYET